MVLLGAAMALRNDVIFQQWELFVFTNLQFSALSYSAAFTLDMLSQLTKRNI